MLVEINGYRLAFDIKRPTKYIKDGEIYLGKSRFLWYSDGLRTTLAKNYHFYIRTNPHFKDTKPLTVEFDKLTSLLESAEELKKKLQKENRTDSELYIALFKLIIESRKQERKIIYSGLLIVQK